MHSEIYTSIDFFLFLFSCSKSKCFFIGVSICRHAILKPVERQKCRVEWWGKKRFSPTRLQNTLVVVSLSLAVCVWIITSPILFLFRIDCSIQPKVYMEITFLLYGYICLLMLCFFSVLVVAFSIWLGLFFSLPLTNVYLVNNGASMLSLMFQWLMFKLCL